MKTLTDETGELRKAVFEGLSADSKHIPCRFLYDERGLTLFSRICRLKEYYITRTELALLAAHGAEIARLAGPYAQLLEFGGGDNTKARIVLSALDRPSAYLPLDVSREHLLRSADALAGDYPDLAVTPIFADYTRPLTLPPQVNGGRTLGFFPGSTIGNLSPSEARDFLRRTAAIIGPGSAMLVGVDLKKDARLLHAAYNDAEGVTAQFLLNLLARINRELDGTFVLDRFEHSAWYNAREGRVEMHIVSREEQSARAGGRDFRFRRLEPIHAENSYKYTIDEFHWLARQSGYRPTATWTDRDRLFSLHYLCLA